MACAAEESESVFFARDDARWGSNPSFEHPMSGHPNDNVHEAVQNFDPTKTCFAFISHRWLRAASGCPDDAKSEVQAYPRGRAQSVKRR